MGSRALNLPAENLHELLLADLVEADIEQQGPNHDSGDGAPQEKGSAHLVPQGHGEESGGELWQGH